MLVSEGGFRVELFELPERLPCRRAPPPGHRPPHPRRQARRLRGRRHRGLAERLRGLGADIVWDVRVHEDVKVLFLRDNTGNLVELVEPSSRLTERT